MDHTDVINNECLLSMDYTSIDQCECRVKGRLPNSRGKEDPEKNCSGKFFVDHVSGVIKTHRQVSLGDSGTIRSKELHEIWASEHGLSIKSYREDNGVCKSDFFKDDLKQRHQRM